MAFASLLTPTQFPCALPASAFSSNVALLASCCCALLLRYEAPAPRRRRRRRKFEGGFLAGDQGTLAPDRERGHAGHKASARAIVDLNSWLPQAVQSKIEAYLQKTLTQVSTHRQIYPSCARADSLLIKFLLASLGNKGLPKSNPSSPPHHPVQRRSDASDRTDATRT